PSGYGYQQQFVPGMRPGGAQLQNYFVPLFRHKASKASVQVQGGLLCNSSSSSSLNHSFSN
ncbi:hypothetical protein KI387_017287, partial [Taxus chinensis]